mgnify:CR=1 FL=1
MNGTMTVDGTDPQIMLVNKIQEFIHFELRKDFPEITMSGIGWENNLTLVIGTEHKMTDAQKEEMRKRIAEQFIHFKVAGQPVPFGA